MPRFLLSTPALRFRLLPNVEASSTASTLECTTRYLASDVCPHSLSHPRLFDPGPVIAFCHNDACRHQAMIDVSSYRPDTLVPWF
jgi:hypothetical protein